MNYDDPILQAAALDAKLETYRRRMLVYLSGKYRDVDEHSIDCNIQRAKQVAVELWKMGFAVICPHANSQHMGFLNDGACFLEGDMVMVERSDLVVMLDNWQESEGAQLERRLAYKLGIPVYYWDAHSLALMRLANDDRRCCEARSVILGRASRIAKITGYCPDGVRAPDVPAAESGDLCGNHGGSGQFAHQFGVLAERCCDVVAENSEVSASAQAC